ncbi:MAG: FkbM family methyltransferase [Gammaproteobacteria bacterium]|nr:FkbM family methyltransferase [Gammaproteobacteria bacterium]MCP4088552.1 FkbM family methyltransferase [Gammaproteobacteria bacterium]MCP4276708.1 FkbM family methyltransferase [Gammaproteobacteria bacterium]MCP4832417.1 FkbM family methyltransferase [Gammaproteobacteria bacterium]MCP4929858.1 FkbM family methyltransferase [Gammaproteobacteria bacterium]
MQRRLQKRVRKAQELMGIGSGEDVSSSGEASVFETLKQSSATSYTVFDIGANQGQFLKLTLDNLQMDKLTIHCFEPGVQTFKMLSDSAVKNERIKLNNIGMGNKKYEATLHFDAAGSGLASLTKRQLDHFDIEMNESETVRIDTIDNYCAENQITHIDLLKIDIEGHELDALEGASGMFAKQAIDTVTFEFGGCNIDTKTYFRDFWNFFVNLDFKLYRITPSGYLYEINSYKEILEQFRTSNFLAKRN